MALASNLKLEIIDVANTSGTPVLGWVFTEGGMDGDFQTVFSTKFRNQGEKYTVPVLVRSLGPSLSGNTTNIPLPDPFVSVNFSGSGNHQISATNDSWTTLSNAAAISALGLAPTNTGEAAYQAAVLNGSQTMTSVGAGNTYYYVGSKRARNDVIRIFNTGFRQFQTIKSGTQEAWLSYNVSSGVNNKRVFAYSLEMLQQISGLSGTEVQFTGEFLQPSELVYWSGFAYSGNCNAVALLLDDTGVTCELPDEFQDEESPIEVCLTGELTSGELFVQINNVLEALRRQESSVGVRNGDAVDNSEVTSSSTSLRYVIYRGLIEYNQPYSGDYICFNSYSYDYTGAYEDAYNVTPPYPTVQTCFSYPQDYTTIDQLVSAINTRLSGSGHYLWNPNICTDDSLSGYFESGGLLKAYKSGNTHIVIESMREGALGQYAFTFFAADRPETGVEIDNVRRYMLPRTIAFQASNNGTSWTTLDTRTNIPWGTIRASVVRDTLYDTYTGFNTGSGGAPATPSQGLEFDISGNPVRTLVYEARITGTNVCALPFDKRVEFYQAPSGFGCREDGEKDTITNETLGETGIETGLIARPVDYFFLKTGWKFNNTTEYNYYRIYLSGFLAQGQTQNIELSDTFYINGINFYGVETGNALLTGSMCLIGASYTGQVMGYTSGVVTGVITGEANAQGEFCVSRYIVSGVPNGNNVVTFQRTTGLGVGLFTGLVTSCATGTGFFTEYVYGYFYNAASQCIEFQKPVSGYITGSGTLNGGPYAIVRDSVIPSITETQVVAGLESGILTGIIPNFVYNFTDIPSFGYLSGTWTETVLASDSGVVNVSQAIYGIPAQAYSNAISGYRQARATMAYNTPVSGDRVFINGTVIIYDPNTGNLAPTYFKTLSELAFSINENSGIFLATGYEDGSNLYLFSTEAGEDGNEIEVSSTGSVTKPTFGATTFTGGATYHYPVTPTDAFQGQLDLDVYATGYFLVSGSGLLTGVIKQLDFIRYFTGVWGISSGDKDFQLLNWVTGSGTRYQNSGFATLPFYSGQPDVIPLVIIYNNSPLVGTTDLVRLTVTGYGTETGLSVILSGQY